MHITVPWLKYGLLLEDAAVTSDGSGKPSGASHHKQTLMLSRYLMKAGFTWPQMEQLQEPALYKKHLLSQFLPPLGSIYDSLFQVPGMLWCSDIVDAVLQPC
jgi:hypothetical protein